MSITHFFLPTILLILKLRRNIIEINILKVTELSETLIKDKSKLMLELALKLNEVKLCIYFDLNYNMISLKFDRSTSLSLNNKLIKNLVNIKMYCNYYSLQNIIFLPNVLNFKNK